jgi:hypothetical protein
LKHGLDYTKEEALELFGPLTDKNGYCYNFNKNLEFVKHIEKLWMIAHQCTKMPTTQIINKALAQGIVCERKNHPINWAMFAKWSIKDQLQKMNLSKVGQVRFERGGVEEEDVESKDNTMPSPSKVTYQVPMCKGVSQGAKGQKIKGFTKGQDFEGFVEW